MVKDINMRLYPWFTEFLAKISEKIFFVYNEKKMMLTRRGHFLTALSSGEKNNYYFQ